MSCKLVSKEQCIWYVVGMFLVCMFYSVMSRQFSFDTCEVDAYLVHRRSSEGTEVQGRSLVISQLFVRSTTTYNHNLLRPQPFTTTDFHDRNLLRAQPVAYTKTHISKPSTTVIIYYGRA